MTFRYRLDNKYSLDSCPPASPGSRFLASVFFVLMLTAVCHPIAQAADKPSATTSGSTSNAVGQCNWINCFGDLNQIERRRPELLPTIQSIDIPLADGRFNEIEILPATANLANTSSAILKTDRWRTDRAVLASSIFEAAWLAADGMTTARLSRGAIEVGSAWAYGRHPTPGRTAAMMAGEFVGIEASSYVLHKMKAPKWVYIAPMMVSGGLHASGAISNIRTGQ